MINWRALMKIGPASEGVHTQNAQNTQNPPYGSNFADIADIADGLRPASTEHDSTVDIAVDVAGEEWDGLTHVERRALVEAVTLRLMRERGQVPPHYTATTVCQHCGPIPIFPGAGEQVAACVWCFRRIQGLPIPRLEYADKE